MSSVAIYVPQCAQTKRIDWVYHTAKSLSQYLPVVLFDVHTTDHDGIHLLSMRWHQLSKSQNKNQHASPFVVWNMLSIIPFFGFVPIQHINIMLNIVIMRLMLLFLGMRPVLIAPPLPRSLFQKMLFWFRPRQVIGDITDFFPKEYRDTLLKRATDRVVNSQPILKLIQKDHLEVSMISAGYFSNETLHRLTKRTVAVRTSKTILCIAHIDWRLDFNLIERILQTFPDYQLMFVGEEVFREHAASGDEFLMRKAKQTQKRWSRLRRNPRVVLCTEHIYALARSHLAAVVGVIPYITTNPFNTYCHPTKTYIYGCLGLPTITTNLKIFSYDKPGYVYVARTQDEFLSHVRSAINRPMTHDQRMNALQRAKDQTYEKKSAAVYALIAR
jgi:hypothetical protein